MSTFTITGTWQGKEIKWKGLNYREFHAQLKSGENSNIQESVGVYLPSSLAPKDIKADYVDVALPEGTYLLRMVPFSFKVEDPTNLSRGNEIFLEDVQVDMLSTSMALPAA